MAEKKYYTPMINEFIPDFKFQYLRTNEYTFGYIDFSNGEGLKEVSTHHTEEWVDCVCDWKYPNNAMFTEEFARISVTYSGATKNFFSSFDDDKIIKLIQDGKIRAIKQ